MGHHRTEARLLIAKALAGLLLLFWGLPASYAQQPPRSAELKYVVVLTRHGVRSPTWTPERLNEYSAAHWPDWGVPPGHLTPHGRALVGLMGKFYREYFAARGLLGKPGCGDASRTYFWADTDQRTIETARSLAETIVPGCKIDVHSVGEGEDDPLFDPIAAGLVKPDNTLAHAVVAARLGPKPESIIEAHRSAFDALDHILNGNGKASKSIFDEPVSLASGKAGVSMTGPLALASTLSEDFLLEYTNGMKGSQLGWGRLDAANLLQIMSLHTTYADLMRRTPYLARQRSSNLMSHVLSSMEQAVTGKPVKGSIGSEGVGLLVVSGHDTNLSNLSGMLGLSWMLPTYQPDDTPPGGALILSLWRSAASAYSVRLQFVAQTLDQMHSATTLSAASPPAMTDVFVPGCSTAQEGWSCEWQRFRQIVQASIDPAAVR